LPRAGDRLRRTQRRYARCEIDRVQSAALLEHQNPWNLRPREWWNLARRVKQQLNQDNVAMVAAGLAFYSMLAVFPLLVAFVAAYGLIADPADVESLAARLTGLLPPGGQEVFTSQLHQIVDSPRAGLGIGLVVSFATLIWSASAGVLALMKAVNVAYNAEETRKWWKLRGTALGLTAGILPAGIVVLLIVAVVPALLALVGVDEHTEAILNAARWPVLALAVFAALTFLYRIAPARKAPPVRWLAPGALIATVLWLALSAGFSFYVQHFGSYAETYGTLGGVIVLLFWFYLSSFVVLLGAEIDAEMERHVCGHGSTDAPRRPRGDSESAPPRPQKA
jgi:membrane protein